MTNKLASELRARGFAKPQYVLGRASIADLIPPAAERCGIYALQFQDGAAYIGQSINVVRRYAQHQQTHSDIERFSFMPCSSEDLSALERELVDAAREAGIPLRNITLLGLPSVDSDFEDILPGDEHDVWVTTGCCSRRDGTRPVDPELRMRYRGRFEQYLALPYAQQVTRVLKEYVKLCIPAPRAGEMSFWSCSCLPKYRKTPQTTYARITINWQEVFAVHENPGRKPTYVWHLARSPLLDAYGRGLPELKERFPFLETRLHRYRPGGKDQMMLSVEGNRNALRVLKDAAVQRATRMFNLRLCCLGPGPNRGNHCLALADLLLDE